MKEAYATFPPILATNATTAGAPAATAIEANGYSFSRITGNDFAAATYVPIDLTGLTLKDKVLRINNIHVARTPSFDNTFPKSTTELGGIYSVRDMFLVTTSPIVATASIENAGIAPAQSQDIQMEYLAGGFTGNNSYGQVTPGILPATGDPTELAFLNLDPNQIVFCQIDTLTSNVQSNPLLSSLLVPVDSCVYGMGNLAALETLYCYRFIKGNYINTPSTGTIIMEAKIGAAIIQMNTQDISMPTLERLQVMDTNFNTTNPLIE
jgi:hypothetical protein